MLLEASKQALAKATARDLEDFKEVAWYMFIQLIHQSHAHLQPDIDPVTAKNTFFCT